MYPIMYFGEDPGRMMDRGEGKRGVAGGGGGYINFIGNFQKVI